MILFDGRYEWTGKKLTQQHPISWWAGSCLLKIIDLSRNNSHILLIKPVIVLVCDTGEGASSKICAPDLMKSVCRDFDLELKKVQWFEYHSGPSPVIEVAGFQVKAEIQDQTLYAVSWRPIRTSELEIIDPFVPEEWKTASPHPG